MSKVLSDHKMNVLDVKPKAAVRWPFRILASLIVLVCVLGVIGNFVVVWTHETPLLKWQFLAVLPLTASLGRLAWHAAIHGRPPASAHWPFASEQAMLWYLIALAIMSHA